jgi:hypothetical protein
MKYVLTGPESIKRINLAHQIGVAIGRDVRFEEQPHAEALAELLTSMGEVAGWYLDGLAQAVDYPQAPDPSVAKIIGRPATTFAQWAVKHAAHFR